MDISEIAKELGRRGGQKRAKNLSSEQRKSIASQGGKKRAESIELKKRIESNFMYVEAMEELAPSKKIKSVSKSKEKLPGIYEKYN